MNTTKRLCDMNDEERKEYHKAAAKRCRDRMLGRPGAEPRWTKSKHPQNLLQGEGPIGSGGLPGARPAEETLLEARARSEAAQRRTPAQTLMGDPPVGYSALDKKEQRV